jgi:uncharacterized repeat protein (TIGR03803 family)
MTGKVSCIFFPPIRKRKSLSRQLSSRRKVMLGKSSHRMLSTTLVLLVFGALLGAAWAQKESVLYSFCAQTSCADGANPMGGLVFDQKGNLYGTTSAGGSGIHGQWGAVFKLAPEGKYTVLYSFCEQNGCSDGALPNAGLIFDRKGDVYGTTLEGGARGSGVVFKLTPEGDYSVLYNFCVLNGCTDGGYPAAGLVFDQKGNLYGTTVSGGANGQGVVFKLTPKGKETVLYSFCALKSSQNDCADGALPYAGLVLDEKGNLYGTTFSGGANNSNSCYGYFEYGCGVVFKLTPNGKETVLYSFCPQYPSCTDGASPFAGLVLDPKGNLYGTTWLGGNNNPCDTGGEGCGVVFKLTPEGEETVLYRFCAQDNCVDGSLPHAGLVLSAKGDLYGTTQLGGAPGGGVVFKLTPEGKETVLHGFCWQDNCTDGQQPYAGLIFDQKGNLYGTTIYGGAGIYRGGVVFRLTP